MKYNNCCGATAGLAQLHMKRALKVFRMTMSLFPTGDAFECAAPILKPSAQHLYYSQWFYISGFVLVLAVYIDPK